MKFPFLNRLQALTASPTSAADAQLQTRAAAMVNAVRGALPELLSVTVINLNTGQALASYASSPGSDPGKAAAFNAEVVHQKRRALKALALPNEKIEDILITLRQQLHLLRISQDDQLLLVLAVSTRDTNLAIARHVLHAHSN